MLDFAQVLALSPVLIPQALWVKLRAARLQEAAGPREGTTGQGPDLRLLVVGDSSGAGVGVAHQDQALIGRLVSHLQAHHRVTWKLAARCGATVGSTLTALDTMPGAQFDVAVIALGVNDAKNGHARSVWQNNYAALIEVLKTRFGVRDIYVSGLPPLGAFPLLPWPLRAVLGRRAKAFDADLRALVSGDAALHYVPLDFPMDPALMAEDGFHPGPKVYDGWARRVADQILERGM